MIDTVSLIHALQGVALLEATGQMNGSVAESVRQWFRDYLRWMMTSSKGKDKEFSGNNHATWWAAQVAAYATFTGDAEARRFAWEQYRNYWVPTEIRSDGSCPRRSQNEFAQLLIDEPGCLRHDLPPGADRWR